MNWQNIRLIFLREARDQLRDRRTLFMVAVLPLLLYPALGLGMFAMIGNFAEQPRTVVVLGERHLPPPQLLDGGRFVSNWFLNPDDASKLMVVTDTAVELGGGGLNASRNVQLIKQAQELRKLIEQHTSLGDELKHLKTTQRKQQKELVAPAVESPAAMQQRIQQLKDHLAAIDRELTSLFAASRIQVLIVIPDGLRENIERVNRLIAERNTAEGSDLSYPRPTIVKNRADDKSVVAYNRVREVLDAWEEEILRQRLSDLGLPKELPNPVGSAPMDLAAEAQISASFWSKMFPALLVIMAVTGAFYPAVDVAAGEKERGTMETLLVCPATRTEIVLGKFFTVMCFSMSTALLNLLSIGATGKYMLSNPGTGNGMLAQSGGIALPSVAALAWLLILLIPLSALFSALCLALATFAHSSKEGQYYLTPLLMVSIGMTVFCMSPGIEIYPVHQASWFYSVIPVVNIALLLKTLLLDPSNTEALIFAGPVLATSIGYSLLALWWAIEQFSSEGVLFRDGERFEPGLWIKHLLRDKEPTPTFTEAGFCFVLIMLAQFATMKTFGQTITSVSHDQMGVQMLKVLVISQIAVIACPALFMALILTTNVRQSLRLRLPNWKFLGVAVVLPLVLYPLVVELTASLMWFFPPLSEGAVRVLKSMSDGNQPLWLIVLAFAVAPAICEELAFRGFVLTGFCRNGRTRLAIILSALTFGVMHMIPQQVFTTTLVGIVLGLIAVRSRSLIPGVVFHFLFNSMSILRERVSNHLSAGHVDEFRQSFWSLFATLEGGGLRYTWLTLVICAAGSSAGLWWVWQTGRTKANAETVNPLFASGLAPAKHNPTCVS
ncbi:MAG: ABC transporter permease subunit [Planctomycetaceae bacterium]|nr:ABC transporter permease subunit [Planctomycetaceae bacterium]